ncbi:hypothetical protein [Caulobacter sp. UNC279MFTsu5.1]|uniref:hypothetical protein n=1 Tax=Caulobacter sp. UNC279MFTsu5.1 TaxID=1502775 RepID=UPI0008E9773F|nr:hypothetical protein [Caulobacter sp. UNC279MFTsu5.1]SFJ15685.1 hypothetical protein SAMN02799626_01217 [Caulobacter sp. UNC279MFTsu5.1]
MAPSKRLTICSALVLAALVSAAPAWTPAWAQVQVQSLAAPDLFSPPAAQTGLSGDLWKDAAPGVVKEALPKLAAKPLSPAAAGLARRVLATGANAPAGIGDDPELGAARAMALIALGEAKGADAVLDRVPGVAASAPLSLAAAEAALITGADDKACRIGEALSVDRGAPYWLRLRAFCQAIGGQRDAAQLTFTLAAQQTKDADYARLMNALLSGAPAGAASLKNGIDYALSRKLGLDVSSAAAVATASPALKAAIKPADAAPPADLTAAQASAVAALRGAKGLPAFTEAAKAALPVVAALARADAPLQDPVLLARAALAAGDPATAGALRGKLTSDVLPAGATTTDLALLDAALAAAEGKKDGQVLDGLIERGVQGGSKSPAQPAALLLAALGGVVSPEARAPFATFDPGKSAAPAGRLTVLDDAAAAGRQGEAALLALSIAADAGPAGPGPVDRARLARALLKAGLEADARAFVVEGLLALQVK